MANGFVLLDFFRNPALDRRQRDTRFAEQFDFEIIDGPHGGYASASAISLRLLSMP